MMNYVNLEASDRKCKITKIALFAISIISIISSLIYIYVINEKDTKNIRRKIDVIEDDITNLYNYTETMSDFLVGDYKPPNDDFNKIYKIQMDLRKELSDFKNESLRVQMDLKKELSDFMNESLRVQMDLKRTIEINKNRTEAFLRKKAIDFLAKLGLHKEYFLSQMPNPTPCPINYNYELDLLKLDKNYYFNNLLKIDYDNFIVSFAYFSDNHEDNFKAHPIYKLINETLRFDYELFYPLHQLENQNPSWLNSYYYINIEGNTNRIYSLETVKDTISYKEWACIPSVEYQRYIDTSAGVDKMILTKVYDEYEYISRIVSFTSIPPQQFL